METEGRLRVVDVFVGIRDPRQAKKIEHDLVELLVIAVCGVLAGADDFVEIEEWAKEKYDWFRQYLPLSTAFPRTTPSAGSLRRLTQRHSAQRSGAG